MEGNVVVIKGLLKRKVTKKLKPKLGRADPTQDSICLGKIKVSKGPMKNKIQSVNELKLPMSTGKEGHISRDFE